MVYEKKPGWPYKAIVKINRVVFDITNSIENFFDFLEAKAYKRWGGYKVTNYPNTNPWTEPWCNIFEDPRMPSRTSIGFIPPKDDEPISPGDIVYFDWNDDPNKHEVVTIPEHHPYCATFTEHYLNWQKRNPGKSFDDYTRELEVFEDEP